MLAPTRSLERLEELLSLLTICHEADTRTQEDLVVLVVLLLKLAHANTAKGGRSADVKASARISVMTTAEDRELPYSGGNL